MADTKSKLDSDSESLGFNEKELEDIMSEIENLEREFVAPQVEDSSIDAEEVLAATPVEELKINSSEVTMTDLQRQIDEELENSLKRIEEMEQTSKEEMPGAVDSVQALKASTDFDSLDSIESASIFQDEIKNEITDEIDEVDSLLMEADQILDNAKEEGFITEMVETNSSLEEELKQLISQENENVIEMKPAAVATGQNHTNKMESVASTQPMSFQAEGQMSMMMNFKIGESEACLKVNGNSGITLSFDGVEVVISEEKGCVVEMSNGVKFNIPLSSKTSMRNVA